MKLLEFKFIALSAAFVVTGYGAASSKSATPAPAAAQPAQKLVRIATLNGVEANREFQSNVQLLQAQRQAAVELKQREEKETDAKKKQELKKQFDDLLVKLNENNDKMQKAYGFSLARNYTLEIETSHIYMLVTDEEAKKIDQAQAEAAKKEKSAKKK